MEMGYRWEYRYWSEWQRPANRITQLHIIYASNELIWFFYYMRTSCGQHFISLVIYFILFFLSFPIEWYREIPFIHSIWIENGQAKLIIVCIWTIFLITPAHSQIHIRTPKCSMGIIKIASSYRQISLLQCHGRTLLIFFSFDFLIRIISYLD